jgi:hypothetical protein
MTKIKFTPSAAIENLEFIKNQIALRKREISNLQLRDKAKEVEMLKEEMGELTEVHATAYCIVHSCLMNPCIEIIDSDVELLIATINKFKK